MAKSSRQITVLLVDDHPAVRQRIKELLAAADDIVVVGEAEDGQRAIELAIALQPDVILLDVELPALRGDAAIREIRARQPSVKVLGVSSYSDPTYVQTMLENGASGYITKDEVPDLLLKAIYGVFENANTIWMSARARRSAGLSYVEEQTLTKKETDILGLLLADRSEGEIAAALAMDVAQVGKHLEILMHKFQSSTPDSLKQVARRILPPQVDSPPQKPTETP